MSSKLFSHGGEKQIGVVGFSPRLKMHEELGTDHLRRHTLADCGHNRPACFARIRNSALILRQREIDLKRVGGKV